MSPESSIAEQSAQQVTRHCRDKRRQCDYLCLYCDAYAAQWRNGDPFTGLPVAQPWVASGRDE